MIEIKLTVVDVVVVVVVIVVVFVETLQLTRHFGRGQSDSKYWEKKNTHWNWGILSTKNTNTNSSIRFDRILLQSSVLIENKTFDTIQIGFTFRIGKRKKNEIDIRYVANCDRRR
ncbi:cyanate hydratase [Sarcoptes scabiei]|nr:cyanate hydratase [Sarcoptes scabiei]